MGQTYTAIIMRDEDWWIGWVDEVNGANAQERTREELLVSLRYAVEDLLEVDLTIPPEIDFVVREVEDVAV